MIKIDKNSKLALILWIVALISIGSLSGLVTKSGVQSWYLNINRSPLTPPNQLFGIVWTILYAMIAASGWLIWKNITISSLNFLKTLFILQLVLNWSWTPIFFGFHCTGLSLLVLSLISFIVFIIILNCRKTLKTVSLLLIPYLLWLLFATHLNYYIWLYN